MSSDRSRRIQTAAAIPKGHPARRAILSSLTKTAARPKLDVWEKDRDGGVHVAFLYLEGDFGTYRGVAQAVEELLKWAARVGKSLTAMGYDSGIGALPSPNQPTDDVLISGSGSGNMTVGITFAWPAGEGPKPRVLKQFAP
jgi:hypothetical protein